MARSAFQGCNQHSLGIIHQTSRGKIFMDVSICIVKDIINTFSELQDGEARENLIDLVYHFTFKGFDPYNLRIVGKTDVEKISIAKTILF